MPYVVLASIEIARPVALANVVVLLMTSAVIRAVVTRGSLPTASSTSNQVVPSHQYGRLSLASRTITPARLVEAAGRAATTGTTR